MGGVGPIAGGQTPQLAGWQTKSTRLYDPMDAYQTPVDLFDALNITPPGGTPQTAAQLRPRGALSARELWDLYDYAHQMADSLSPELREKYGIVPGTNPFAGKNPYGYPGSVGEKAVKNPGRAGATTGSAAAQTLSSTRPPGTTVLTGLLDEGENSLLG